MSDIAATPADAPRRETETVVVRRHVNWPLRIAKVLLGLVVGLAVLAALLVTGLNSDPGRRFVAERIAGLEFANGMKIGVGRIEGSLYGAMTLRQLTLSDTRGVFLTVPQARVDWRPFAYLQDHVDVRSFLAPTATLARVPQFRVTPPSNEPLLPDLDITIGRLKVDRVIIERPVTGERRVASIDGKARIADRRAQVVLQAAAIGGAGRIGGDRIALKLDAVPEANRLGLDMFVSAPRGGVVAALAGLDKPLILRVNGQGDWRKWDGRLSADLDNGGFARLALTARNGTFGVRGATRVARLFTGPTAALLGPITTVAAQSTWENRRANLSAVVGSDAFRLVANGVADLGRSAFDGMKVQVAVLKPGLLAPNLGARDLRIAAALDGLFRQPTVDYRLTATTLAFNDMGLRGFEAAGVARWDRDHLTVPVAARARAITGLDTVAGGTLTNVRLDGDLAVDWPRIVSDNLRIRSDRIDAKLILLSDVSKGLYTGAIEGRINDYLVSSVGIFDIDTQADVKTLANGGYALVGRVRARSTRLFNEGVRSFLGGNLVGSSDVAYGTDGIIRFSRLRMTAPLLRVTDGRGTYRTNGQIVLAATGVSKAYGPVGVQVTGTLDDPRVNVTASRPGLGLGLNGVRAQVRRVGNSYAVLATGNSQYGAFTADLSVLSGAGPLTLDIRRATLAGITARGRVRQTAAGPYEGRLDATGQGLGGVIRLSAAGRYQQAIVNVRARDTVLPAPANIAVGSAIIDARVILYDRPEVIADAQISRARIGTTDLNAMRAQVNYRGGRGFARVIAEGTSGVPFRVALNSDLQPELWRAAIIARINGVDVRTDSPARIVPRGSTYELLPTRLVLDRGSARVAGLYSSRELRVQSRIDRLDMAVIDALVPGLGIGGNATGSIDFAQVGNGLPRAEARLAIRNFTRTTAASVSQALDVNLVAALQPDGGNLLAVMRTRGTVVGRVQAAFQPLGAGAGSWSQRIAGAPVRGGIRYVGPADALFSLAGLADQRLSGPLGVAADFTGRVSQPALQGIVRGRNLTYDNASYGTRLSNMALAGRFTGERLEIDTLTAAAGAGTVTGKGYVSLASASGYPARFDLSLNNARLANSDALRATATGDVVLAKTPNQTPVLSGTVRLPATRYAIIRQNAAQVAELTGVRFKPPRGPARITGDAAPAPPSGFGDVALDLRIIAPSQLFVSGMGLESEWRADMQVNGTNTAPRIGGEVNLVRGALNFAGRSFTLREGRIRFTGGATTDAQIVLSAEESIEDVDVTVNVAGSVTNPQITFTSTPGLPQDEIVARILFGSSVGNLSAIQAVQLAASLNSLRGSGGGLNPLGKLRAVAGIDRLRILGADDTVGRGTALAAGKYITDNIYLEVVTDARGFTATQLEIALSRSLSVLSQAGGSGSTNVNVRYRKVY